MLVLEVRHLRVVDAIRREGSVSRAAHRLHLTQPAVSHALKNLEGRLGVELFVRQNKRMVPTPEGERLLQSADVVLDELTRAEHDIDQLKEGQQGVIRIATGCYTCYNWLPMLLRDFRDEYPAIDLQIVPSATDQPIEALLDRRLDVAIVDAKPQANGIVCKRLFRDEMVAIVPSGDVLTKKRYLSAADFADQHYISQGGLETTTCYREVLAPAGVMPARTSVIPLTEAVIQTVRAGWGITVMARWLAAPELDAGAIDAVRVTPKGLRRTWYAVTLDYRAESPALAALVRLLKRHGLDAATSCQLPASPLLRPARGVQGPTG